MSLYSQRLAHLKRELVVIKQHQKKKPFKENQIIMMNFINGLSKKAIFTLNDQEIILEVGDAKKGFHHILITHYCSDCPGKLTARDIINMDRIITKGFRLHEVGVSNTHLVVYQYMKGDAQYKLVLKPRGNNSLVVTMYSIG